MAISHPEWSADRVRGGAIIFTKTWQKMVFMAGLFGGVVVLALLVILGL